MINTSSEAEQSKSIKLITQVSQQMHNLQYEKLIDFLSKKQYILKEFLNSGGFAAVFIGHLENKPANKLIFKAQKYYQEDELEIVKEEYQKVKNINGCSHIVKYYDLLIIPEIQTTVIVMEYCKSSLFIDNKDRQQMKAYYTSEEILKMIFDLFQGLIEMKNHFICHLDIKQSNILIKENGDYVYCDFGISSILYLQKISFQNSNQRTPNWCSPEQLEDDSEISYSSDVYSLGLVLSKTLKLISKDENSRTQSLIDSIDSFIQTNMLVSNKYKRMRCEVLPVNFCMVVDIKQYPLFYANFRQKLITILNQPIFKSEEDYQLLGRVTEKVWISSEGTGLEYFTSKEVISKNEQKFQSKSLSHLNYAILELITLKGNQPTISQQEVNTLVNFFDLQTGIEQYKEYLDKIFSSEQKGIDESLQRIGRIFYKVGQLKPAIIFLQKALSLRESLPDQKKDQIVNCLSLLAYCYCAQNDGSSALLMAQRSYNLISLNDLENISNSQNWLGYSYFQLKRYYEALKCFENALEAKKNFLREQQGNNINLKQNKETKIQLATCFNNIGLCYLYLNIIKKAEQYLYESFDVRNEYYKDIRIELVTSINNMSVLYFMTRGAYFEHSLDLCFEALLKIQFFHTKTSHYDKITIYNNLQFLEEYFNKDKGSLNIGGNPYQEHFDD